MKKDTAIITHIKVPGRFPRRLVVPFSLHGGPPSHIWAVEYERPKPPPPSTQSSRSKPTQSSQVQLNSLLNMMANTPWSQLLQQIFRVSDTSSTQDPLQAFLLAYLPQILALLQSAAPSKTESSESSDQQTNVKQSGLLGSSRRALKHRSKCQKKRWKSAAKQKSFLDQPVWPYLVPYLNYPMVTGYLLGSTLGGLSYGFSPSFKDPNIQLRSADVIYGMTLGGLTGALFDLAARMVMTILSNPDAPKQ